MTRKSYLIQGVFFQQPALGCTPEILQATVCMPNEKVVGFPYSGVIRNEPGYPIPGKLVGVMQDVFGHSRLTNIEIGDDVIRFTKTYVSDGHNHAMEYEFTINELTVNVVSGYWIGTYDGPECGYGVARCLIVDVSETFFRLPAEEVLSHLGLTTAHEWPEGRG